MGTVVAQDIVRVSLYVIILLGGIVQWLSPQNNFIRNFINF
jgi:predicted phage tail protein